mmetsp:Transcript_1196/g.1077  ORF Transcript_1196/g.1077 Transcript_1196/m.1077 type:complete len:133 (+) Transcript_1196:1742-2140(+)
MNTQTQGRFLANEMFQGLKNERDAQLYPFLFLCRRVVLCALLIFGRGIGRYSLTILYVFINYLQNIYIIRVKPFISMKNNFMAMINGMIYINLCTTLLFIYEYHQWSIFFTYFYYGFLVANIGLNSLISITY